MKEQNATIKSTTLDIERGLSAWLHLDYGGTGQGFGGFILYAKHAWTEGGQLQANYAGHFIQRCIEIGGVEQWEKLPGRNIRVRREDGFNGKVIAIGHITNDDWFNPQQDFEDYKRRFSL